MLKQYLSQQEKNIMVNQTLKKQLRAELFPKKNFLQNWKITLPIALSGIGLALVLVILWPKFSMHSGDFMARAQDAMQQDLINQKNYILHQKYSEKYYNAGNEQIVSDYQTELWVSPKDRGGMARKDYNNSAGQLDNETIYYNNKEYDYFMGMDSAAANEPTGDANKPWLYCTDGGIAAGSIQSTANDLQSAFSNSTNAETRVQALEKIVSQKIAQDLGEQNGLRVFALTDAERGVTVKYYFDPQSLQLKKYTAEDSKDGELQHIIEYQVDEYLDIDFKDLAVLSDITNLKEIKSGCEDGATPNGECQMPDLTGKPAGCYNTAGEKISDLSDAATCDPCVDLDCVPSEINSKYNTVFIENVVMY